MKLKVKPCKYCNEHAIEISRCPDINPMEPVRMLCTKCNFQIYGATEKEAIERWNKEYDLVHKPKGVMIVGMEMPESCRDCVFMFESPVGIKACFVEKQVIKRVRYLTVQRAHFCPLQEAN